MSTNHKEKFRRAATAAFTDNAWSKRQAGSPVLRRKSHDHRPRLGFALTSASALALALGSTSTPVRADELIDNQTVTVPGDQNSPWIINDHFVVGGTGQATLIIQNGGIVDVNLAADIGAAVGSSGTVQISGNGSALGVSGAIDIGDEGHGVVMVTDGADLTVDSNTYIGAGATSSGTLTVSGTGSTWTSTFNVVVGALGTASVTVSDGALVNHGLDLFVGGVSGGGQVLVTGAGSTWNALANARVGTSGSGAFEVREGASFHVTQDLFVGDQNLGPGLGGSVTVTGQGSKLTYDTMTVGHDGNGALRVEDGATAGGAGQDVALGINATGQGSVQISGAGSTLTADNLWVGNHGTASLSVDNGGKLVSDDGTVGRHASGTGTVSITGKGSLWTATGSLEVGLFGTGAVIVSGGGTVDLSSHLRIGEIAGSKGTVTVTGAGSAFNIGNWVRVGGQAEGDMFVADGASVVQTGELLIGSGTNVTGTAIVTGVGSSWQVLQNLVVSDAG